MRIDRVANLSFEIPYVRVYGTMKIGSIAALLAATVVASGAAAKREPDLVVYLHAGNANPKIIIMAEQLAARMLERVGVMLMWRRGSPMPQGNAEVVEAVLIESPPSNFKPEALAFATLGAASGTRIGIFYNRVLSGGPPDAVPSILAHVLVHEITHVLEGVGRHSSYGVMKARWDMDDVWKMSKLLPFAPEDVALIRDWEARRHDGGLPATTVAWNLPLPAAGPFPW